jgi:autotransporter-associated beta strand protein
MRSEFGMNRNLSCIRVAVWLVVGTVSLLWPRQVLAQRVLGLDISAWQGNITQTTWNNLRQVENRQFVFLRSSRGGTTGFYNQNNAGNDNPPGQNTLSQRYDDPYFVQNINRASAAGMFAGSYHFSRPDIIASTLNSNGIPNHGTDEANHFIQMAGAWMRPGYLVPVHDFEAGDGFRTDNEMAQFAIDFSNRISEVMGVRPAIYVNGNYAHNILGGASATLRNQVVSAYPTLWSARWPNQSNPDSIDIQNGHPKDSFSTIYGPWDDSGVTHPWQFWQYASTGRLQSFNSGNSNLDMNVSQGDLEYLKDQLVPALWMNNASGDWSTLTNWNSGTAPIAPVTGPGQVPPVGTQTLPTPRLPGAAGTGVTSGQHDTVILDRPNASITVNVSTGSHTIRKLFMRETLNITGGSLEVLYDPGYTTGGGSFPNALRSGPLSAQFSGAVSLSGTGVLSVHTLQVDSTRVFTLGGGTLNVNRIQLMPHNSAPAKILVTGDITLSPLANASAVIANGSGTGNAGFVDLAGGDRVVTVGDGSAAVDVTISVPMTNGGLTKAGAGTLSLTGANSYTGDTRVEAGTLKISSPFLANSSYVYLTSNATLDLGFFIGPDIIDSLFIDGVSQPAGIWGAVGSGAQFTSPWITGLGFLQVTTSVRTGDFDFDGDFDCADINALVSQIASGGNMPAFDLTGDALVNASDLEAWRIAAGAANLPSGSAYLPGDGNLDGVVDGSDFNLWNGNKFTSVAAWCSGDFNADGQVDGSDFSIWNSQKFTSSDRSAAVPEPALAFWTFLGLVAMARRPKQCPQVATFQCKTG